LNVRFWHLVDNPTASAVVRYWSNSGQWMILARDRLSANDPKRTTSQAVCSRDATQYLC
jgi:hypothetical protein